MPKPQTDQRRLKVGGTDFHFVSYEEQPANARRGEPGYPAMWFLMRAGKRWAVMPVVEGQEPAETDRALLRWIEDNIIDPGPDVAQHHPAVSRR
ncbi:MAG TPA: hypothetical protein VNL98_02880 [Gemmatimonadales bacterium]|nr:hypothetical protein [Gemmatimonadales bacterium]